MFILLAASTMSSSGLTVITGDVMMEFWQEPLFQAMVGGVIGVGVAK